MVTTHTNDIVRLRGAYPSPPGSLLMLDDTLDKIAITVTLTTAEGDEDQILSRYLVPAFAVHRSSSHHDELIPSSWAALGILILDFAQYQLTTRSVQHFLLMILKRIDDAKPNNPYCIIRSDDNKCLCVVCGFLLDR